MALFKILRGSETALPENKIDGYAYFCTDTGSFFIDHQVEVKKEDGTSEIIIARSKISANCADKLRYLKDGEICEIEPKDIVTTINILDIIKNVELPYFTLKDEITGNPHKLHISNGVLMLDNQPISGGNDDDDDNDDSDVVYDSNTGDLKITNVAFEESTSNLTVVGASFNEINGNLII